MVVDGSIKRHGLIVSEPAFRYPVSMELSKRDGRSTTGSGSTGKGRAATYQTRVSEYAGTNLVAGDVALLAYAELYGRVQRKLFAEVAAGRSAVSLKSEYLQRYQIPARMYNGLRVSLEGKVASVKEQQKLRVDSLGRRLARAQRQIADAAERGRWDQVHQKRRRLGHLQSRLATLEEDVEAGRVRLCFGSKRLWRKQHHLAEKRLLQSSGVARGLVGCPQRRVLCAGQPGRDGGLSALHGHRDR